MAIWAFSVVPVCMLGGCDSQDEGVSTSGGAAAPAGPCDGVPCGQPCMFCPTDELNCATGTIPYACDMAAQCVPSQPTPIQCAATPMAPANPCAGQACGTPCQSCPPSDPMCMAAGPEVCNNLGQCVAGDSTTVCMPNPQPMTMPMPMPTTEQVACTELASSWQAGTATCTLPRTQCDVSACERADVVDPKAAEWVMPALRNPDRWSGAVCNDGSPFGFQVKLSARPEVRDWVIVFTGAGMCDEYAFRCRNRSNTHTPYDADGMPIADKTVATLVEEGIFDPMGAINMVFADAHMVLVRDCSNDYWTGSTTEPKRVIADVVDMTAVPEDWVFNGGTNFMSVFEVLAERFGLNDADEPNRNPTRVLLVGSSGGGAGVIANARRASAILPATVAARRFRVLLDGFYLPDWTGYGDEMALPDSRYLLGRAEVRDDEAYSQALNFWGGQVDAGCASTAGNNAGFCLLGPSAIRYLSAPDGLNLPTMVQQHIFDANLLRQRNLFNNDCNAIDCLDDGLKTAWRDAMFEAIESEHLKWGVFDDRGIRNTLVLGDSNWNLMIGTSNRQVVFSEFVREFFTTETPEMGRVLKPDP